MTVIGAADAVSGWVTALNYTVPAATAFAGALLGAWLKGRHDRAAREADEHREWRKDAADHLPAINVHIDDALQSLERAAYLFENGPGEEYAAARSELFTATEAIAVVRPFLTRLAMLHTQQDVRRTATEMDRAVVTLPLEFTRAFHPSRGGNFQEHGARAITEVRKRSEYLAAALRGETSDTPV